jgi:hypothetical protein
MFFPIVPQLRLTLVSRRVGVKAGLRLAVPRRHFGQFREQGGEERMETAEFP